VDFGTKLLLTSLIFMIIGYGMAKFGDDTDTDWSLMVGMAVGLIAAIVFIISLLTIIWF
jgi:hypothetical protein